MRSSLEVLSGFAVDDLPDHWVAIEPVEGAGKVAQYFAAHRLADARTDLTAASTWAPIAGHPPFGPKPTVRLPDALQARLSELQQSSDLLAVVERLGAAAVQADAATLPDVLCEELPELFKRYPRGSLWYVSVDALLVRRLRFMLMQMRLELTPDVEFDFGAEKYDNFRPFGMHTTTEGSNFGSALHHLMLAVSPTALGFTIGVLPHAVVFMFGDFVDLRDRRGPSLAARYLPQVGRTVGGVPGLKFPAQNLPAGHLESLLAWWTTRLNVVYSYAADPTNFSTTGGVHDVTAQAAWFFTLERMMADAAVMLAAVDAPVLLRMQSAFDLLDKAESLLHHGAVNGKSFKKLLRREEVMPRLERAFDGLPVQTRERFKRWAHESYDRFYDDVKATTMKKRCRPDGVLVALNDPAKPVLRSWDEYVATLMRTARNSSHGLQQILMPPGPGDTTKQDARLLLATNSGDVPDSFHEVVAVVFFGLMADAERLCARTWWS
jgi:hypothetical protein